VRIERFEDIEAWKEARALVGMVYQATNGVPFRNDRGLREQIQRAAISVMSNVAEGFMRQTNKEFIVFLGYSLRSSAEVQSQLYAALDLHYVDEQTFKLLAEQCNKVARMLQAFIRYLKTVGPPTNKPLDRRTNEQTAKRTNEQTN
jgi:four helix bundle protein